MLPNGNGTNGSQNTLVAGVDAIGAPRDANGVQQDNVQYIGPTGAADRTTWLARITDQANWTGDNTGTINSSVVTKPVIALFGGDTVSYREGDSFVALDAGSDATVSDADSANFDGGRLTVSIDNPIAGEDVLAVRNEGSAAGQIGVSGASVTYAGVAIGSMSGGAGGQPLVIAFNGNATPEATQALLRNLVYANSNPTAPTPGARTVQVTLEDGDGGSTSAAPVNVDVIALNTPPTLDAIGGTVTFTENGAAVDLFDSAAISTVEPAQSITQLVLTVDQLANGGQEFLSIDGTDITLDQPGTITTADNGLTVDVSLNAGTATIAISAGPGGFSAAIAEALVDGLAYRNASEAPDITPREITLTSITDSGGTLNGGADTRTLQLASTVAIVAVNDPPTMVAPSSFSVIEDVPLALTGIVLADVDAGNAPVDVLFSATSGTLTAASTNGVSVQGGGGSAVTLSGSIADINGFIAAGQLAFTTAPDATGDVSLTITIDDRGNTGIDPGNSGTASSEAASSTIVLVVSAVNDAPVNGVPGSQMVRHDTDLVFSSSTGNALSVSDVDAGNSPVQVTLTASNGLLTLAQTSGLTLQSGSGTNDSTVSFEGSLADINAALDGLVFAPTPGHVGPAGLQITSNDLGASGSGGSQGDTDMVAILVEPDRPQVSSVHATNADATYKIGDTITLTIDFDQAVTLDTSAGTPSLLLETGAIDRSATYVSGSGSNTLSFSYTVQPGDSTPDLDYTSPTALQLNGATLRNSNGIDAALTLPPAEAPIRSPASTRSPSTAWHLLPSRPPCLQSFLPAFLQTSPPTCLWPQPFHRCPSCAQPRRRLLPRRSLNLMAASMPANRQAPSSSRPSGFLAPPLPTTPPCSTPTCP